MTRASAAALAGLGLMGVARDNLPRDGFTYSFMAGFAEVEVDVETGDYRLVDYLGVADVGTVHAPEQPGRADPWRRGAGVRSRAQPAPRLRPAVRRVAGQAPAP